MVAEEGRDRGGWGSGEGEGVDHVEYEVLVVVG